MPGTGPLMVDMLLPATDMDMPLSGLLIFKQLDMSMPGLYKHWRCSSQLWLRISDIDIVLTGRNNSCYSLCEGESPLVFAAKIGDIVVVIFLKSEA